MKYKKSCTKKNKRTRRKKGGDPTIKDIIHDSAWVKRDGSMERWIISVPYIGADEYKEGGYIVLVRDPEHSKSDERKTYKSSDAFFDDFAQARRYDGGRKKKTRKKRGGVLKDIALNDIKVGQRYTVTITSYQALFPTGFFRGTFEGEQERNQQRHFHFSTTTTELPRPNAPIEISIPEEEIQRVQQYNITPYGDPYLATRINAFVGGRRKKKTRKYKGNKYPYKNITKKEAIADFIKLKTTTNPRSLNGLEIVNYGTEKLRVRTKYRGKSLIQRWKDKKARKTLKKFANRLYKGSYTDDLLHAYRSAIALSWGTLSSMRTSAALQMYRKYNAKKVLDFTAGWGSRMTAALAADIDYIGIDSNKSLKKGYNKIIKTVKKHTKSKVKLFFQPAETVNYSKLDYDFVFTSPPYEYLELYEHMKNYEGTKKIKQAHSANDKRRKNDGFYDTFLIPTIKEIYKHLPKGKWMCLNVPDLMYDKIKKKWKACNKKEDYMISKRVGSNMKSDDRRGQEFVYCWKKS